MILKPFVTFHTSCFCITACKVSNYCTRLEYKPNESVRRANIQNARPCLAEVAVAKMTDNETSLILIPNTGGFYLIFFFLVIISIDFELACI